MEKQCTWRWVTKEEKQGIRTILISLTDWFGLPEACETYILDSKKYDVLGCFREKELIGFLTLKPTSDVTVEVYVMGIYEDYHHRHIGKKLIEKAIVWAKQEGYYYMQVKTLDPRVKDAAYLKTYAFYCAMGFQDVEVLPLWDEWNPCLLMIKNLR